MLGVAMANRSWLKCKKATGRGNPPATERNGDNMTIEGIRNYAKEKGLSEKKTNELIAELHPDENGELSLEESAQAFLTVNHIADTINDIRSAIEATKTMRNQRGKKTEAEKKAKKKYRDQGKRMTVDFYPSEADLIEWIEKQPNKQGYIKSLIRADMEKNKNNGEGF